MFADFVPMQLDCLRQYTSLLPGVAETTQKLQKDGIKIGSTTGFVRSMVDILEEDAKKQGYTPDASVAGDEVVHGARPKPFMVYKNLDMLDVHPIQSVVKVDDTISGVGEALEAGCWGVGIARYSNYMDIDSFGTREEPLRGGDPAAPGLHPRDPAQGGLSLRHRHLRRTAGGDRGRQRAARPRRGPKARRMASTALSPPVMPGPSYARLDPGIHSRGRGATAQAEGESNLSEACAGAGPDRSGRRTCRN